MMTEGTGTRGRHRGCDQQELVPWSGSHNKPARSRELKCDQKSVLVYYRGG